MMVDHRHLTDKCERDKSHGNVHSAHSKGRRLALRRICSASLEQCAKYSTYTPTKAGLLKDGGGVEDGAVDPGELLGEHHHHRDDQRLPQRAVHQHLLQGHLKFN